MRKVTLSIAFSEALFLETVLSGSTPSRVAWISPSKSFFVIRENEFKINHLAKKFRRHMKYSTLGATPLFQDWKRKSDELEAPIHYSAALVYSWKQFQVSITYHLVAQIVISMEFHSMKVTIIIILQKLTELLINVNDVHLKFWTTAKVRPQSCFSFNFD